MDRERLAQIPLDTPTVREGECACAFPQVDRAVCLENQWTDDFVMALGTEAIAGSLTGAKWIWHATGGAGINAPAGTWYFRRSLVVPGEKPITSAVCSITADNAFTLLVNGKKVGSGDNWQDLQAFDLKKVLTPGENLLAVEAVNWKGSGENPAGLIVSLRVGVAGGKTLAVRSDGTWRTSAAVGAGWSKTGFDDSRWRPVRVVNWNGWQSVAENAGTLRTNDPLVEPETRTLSEEEGEALIAEEWFFQAEGKPLEQRAVQEIRWTREMAERMAKADRPPRLDAELADLESLEGDAKNLSPEELYRAVRRVKRRIMFKNPLLDFSRLAFIDAPERYAHESMHRVYPQA